MTFTWDYGLNTNPIKHEQLTNDLFLILIAEYGQQP